MKVIGLTGGIGSGKSTVANLFAILGCAHFNSDQVAKQVYFLPIIREKVLALLGTESYKGPTSLNTSYISSKVFSNTDLLHRLNAIIHPAVKDEFRKFCEQQPPKSLILKETALLFEANLQSQADILVVVAAPEELRIHRVMNRDKTSREEVLKRIKSQMPQEEKIKRADFVIMNDEKQSLIEQVTLVYKHLLSIGEKV
jgi:dephospho-CoA kinase